jgi:hypothetical protein
MAIGSNTAFTHDRPLRSVFAKMAFDIVQDVDEPRLLSRYSDWLRAGPPRGTSSSPGRVKNVLFSISSRPALGSTQPPIQLVPGALFPRVTLQEREADHSPPTSAEVEKTCLQGKENEDIVFIRSFRDIVSKAFTFKHSHG